MARIISSLNAEDVYKFITKYGAEALPGILKINWLETAQTGSQLYTDHTERQTLGEQRKAWAMIQKAIPEFLRIIESKDIRVVPRAFNSSSLFITAFQSAALAAIPVALLGVKDAITRVGSAIEGISSELAITNVSKIQGWENDGFGSHIYRFVLGEMKAVAQKCSTDKRRHYFYVWNPDTDWYTVFEKKQRKKPLGKNFGGYHTDLAAICSRMSSDRATLVRTTSYGRDAVFHLLIPAYEPIVTERAISFHSSLFPLVITGQRHRQTDLVWFDMPRKPEGLDLDCIGRLDRRPNAAVDFGWAGFVTCWAGAASCAAAATLFPPLAPAAMIGGEYFCQAGVASGFVAVFGDSYERTTQEAVSVLGVPLLTLLEPMEIVSKKRRYLAWFGASHLMKTRTV